MEDVLEMLWEANTGVAWGLETPSEEALVEVEEQILVALPREYREFLEETGTIIVGSLEPATAADPNAHNYLPEMCAKAWDLGVSREVIPMCEDNGGYYCVTENGEVQYWVGEEMRDETWDSVWHWARDVWLES